MKVGNEVDAGSKSYWCGGTNEMPLRVGTPAGEHGVTAGWLCPEKGYHSLSSLPLTQPGH